MMAPSRWSHKVRRLAAMPLQEIADRARQRSSAQVDSWLYLAGHEFAHPNDANDQSGNFFFSPGEVPELCELLRQRFPETAASIVWSAELACDHRFDLLGYPALDYGREIDWHFDPVHGKRAPRLPFHRVPCLDSNVVGDSKITWELNRHQHFVTLAKAWRLTGDPRFAREIVQQFQHWQAHNPYPIGINWASRLEVALRSMAWIWTWFLLADCTQFSPEIRSQWMRLLQISGRHIERYLSTYFSPNTHLLGEAAALFFLGTLFPSLPSSQRWRAKGWDLLWRSATLQIREDGFYFEQSTHYHVYALDMLLHSRILASRNGWKIPPEADQLLLRMFNALMLLGRAGQAHRFGDDDGGRLFDSSRNRAEHLLDPLATGAALFLRSDLKSVVGGFREESLWLLGRRGLDCFDSLPSALQLPSSSALPQSGFYLSAASDTAAQLLIDAGPMGAGSGGHAHADALSLNLIAHGQPLLLDPGTLDYTQQSGERDRLRSTPAHNTMTVDGQNQAEITGAFSWNTLPSVTVEHWITNQNFDLFLGHHDGYARLPDPVIHRRLIFRHRDGFWFVLDRASGRGRHKLDVAWHLAPSLEPYPDAPSRFAAGSLHLTLLTAPESSWMRVDRTAAWSPAYGLTENCPVVAFERDGQLPAELATVLLADDRGTTAIGTLKQLKQESHSVSAYQYSTPGKDYLIFVSTGAAPWNCGAWASDAFFVLSSTDRATAEQEIIFCGGTQVDFEGKRILSASAPVRYAWGRGATGVITLLSSEPAD